MKHTTKNFTADMPLTKDVANILETDFADQKKAITRELRSFISEAQSYDGATKNYTPERIARILANIESYYSINKIAKREKIELFIKQASTVLDGGAMKIFSHTAHSVSNILYELPKRVYDDSELYFTDEDTLKDLLVLKHNLEEHLVSRSYKKRFAFSTLVNILNEDNPSHKYNVKYTPKFIHISEKDSIDKYIDAHYHVSRNWENKNFKEFLATHKFDPETIKRLEIEHKAKLKKQQEEYEFLRENHDNPNINIKILDFEEPKLYPKISVTITAEKRSFERHLRSEVPNLLWFIPRPFKKNMKIKEFLEEATHAFGSAYYIVSNKEK